MSGSKMAAEKLRRKYGKDYFREIGRKGGSAGWYGKGFASELISKGGLKVDGAERARLAGARGIRDRTGLLDLYDSLRKWRWYA